MILSSGHRPNFNGWPSLTKYWPSFANFNYSFLTIWPSNSCHTLPIPISHHILQIQRSDFGFKSKALWTCVVVPTHQEILIGHVLLIQLFDWAQNSSKPIFYPTILIQWSNFKSNCSTRWMRVVASTYHETSITKNIQYSSKRVISYINISKNRENYLQNTTKNLENDPNGFTYDLLLCHFKTRNW